MARNTGEIALNYKMKSNMTMKKEKTEGKAEAAIQTEQKKKSKFALYWESRKEREPGLEIVDMRAVLK
jgi:hypothetical protein